MSTQPDIRNGMIDQAQQQRAARDTIILQKVNRAQREGFKQRFPGQLEHMMRLTAERLQAVLTNKPKDLTDPETWKATAAEIRDLSEALYYLSTISQDYPCMEE